jgi:endo-1,4-beta-xylanase
MIMTMKKISQYKYIVLILIGIMIFFIYCALSGRSFLSVSAQDDRINLLESGWNYLPGVSPQPDGLRISYLGREIVQQDGSGGQKNPPVNIYGTHLQTSGNFTLHATLKDIEGSAVLRLYDSPPIIQDEFRAETGSLELALRDNIATVSVWNNYVNENLSQQEPVKKTSYAIPPSDTATLAISRQNGRVMIDLNGKRLAVLPESNLLKDRVWFGLSTENPNDSWALTQFEVDASADILVVNTQDVKVHTKSNDALQVTASKARPGFSVGAAAALGPMVEDSSYGDIIFGGHFGQITTENALKWQFIHPQPDVYDFREADALVDLAKKNNLSVHGHTLVFGEANPAWVRKLPNSTTADKNYIRKVMTDHIAHTVGHFRGKIVSWDVVNEPLANFGTVPGVDGLRKNIWHEALGETYIGDAFVAARNADPQVKLYINEFGLEADGARWETFLALMKKLKSQGVPIDGVGFQAHVYDSDDVIDTATLRRHIRELAALGLESRISEMDVYSSDGAAAQAKQYADVFNVCVTEPSCVSWSTWGVTDRYNLWQDKNGRLQDGRDFLWDEKSRPTPAVSAIRDTLMR